MGFQNWEVSQVNGLGLAHKRKRKLPKILREKELNIFFDPVRNTCIKQYL